MVRFADQIAYVNHDIEDAIRAGVLHPDALPKESVAVLGSDKSARITTMIQSMLAHGAAEIGVQPEQAGAFAELRAFMYATVYVDEQAKREEKKVEKMLAELYERFLETPERMPNFYLQIAYNEGADRAVTDYISGMSDEFAIRTFEDFFVAKRWHVL